MDKELDHESSITLFCENVRMLYEKAEEDFMLSIQLSIPVSEEDYELTLKNMEEIRKRLEEINIQIRIGEPDDALKEYGQPFAFVVSRLHK